MAEISANTFILVGFGVILVSVVYEVVLGIGTQLRLFILVGAIMSLYGLGKFMIKKFIKKAQTEMVGNSHKNISGQHHSQNHLQYQAHPRQAQHSSPHYSQHHPQHHSQHQDHVEPQAQHPTQHHDRQHHVQRNLSHASNNNNPKSNPVMARVSDKVHHSQQQVCKFCSAPIYGSFRYCPMCGNRLR